MTASPLSATTTGPRYVLADRAASRAWSPVIRYVVLGGRTTLDKTIATDWTEEEARALAANNPNLLPCPQDGDYADDTAALAESTTEPTEPDWDALADRQRDRMHAGIVDALVGAQPQPEDVTTVREYALPSPTLIDHPYGTGRLVASRLRVSVTRFPQDPTEEPYVRVEAYTVAATKTGRPNVRAARGWVTMPDALAAHLTSPAATLRRLTDPYPNETHRGTGTLPTALHTLAVTGMADVFHDHTREGEPWTARITQAGRDTLASALTGEEPTT